jgi:Ni,Fe-hydrogenase I cytochrome b subunit
MWLRRLLLRVIVKTALLVGAMWFVLRDVEGPADQFFPYAYQRQLKWALVLLIVCALILIFWRVVRVIFVRLRYRA